MKFLAKAKDGGQYSTVWGYWLIEIKSLFSIVLLRFEDGSRDAYHSHTFNCFSWVLSGWLIEQHRDGRVEWHQPSWRSFVTRRTTFHKVVSVGRSWVISVRGPWARTWQEYLPREERSVQLTGGRREI